jgi:hypothetical protein
MRRILSLAAAAVLALTGCDRAITEPYGPLTGTWRYRATGFERGTPDLKVSCAIETTLVIRQEGNEIVGTAAEAPYTCTHFDGRTYTSTQPNGVVAGEVQDGRVHFSNAGGWHSFGELGPDRVEGYLESYGGQMGPPMQSLRSGSFVMERISKQGFHGPRA